MTFQEWLRTPGLDRCYLIEMDYLLNGDKRTLRRATHPFRTAGTDAPAWYPYPDTVLTLPDFDRDMSEVFTGASRVAVGEAELYLDEQLQELVETAVFSGQQVRMYVGDAAWPLADFGQILVGQIDQVDAVSFDTAKLTFKDRAAIFNQPMQVNTIATGPNAGNPVPLCFGECFNVSPVLIDPITKLYRVHSGAVQSITGVRENGQPIPFTANNSAGTFALTNNAQGRVTADVQGAVIDGDFLTTADQLINHIVTTAGIATPVGDLLPDYTLGLYINSDATIADVLDEVVASVGGAWFFDRLNRVVKVFFSGVGAASDVLALEDVEDDSLLPVRRIAPARSVSVGYARNWTPQADGLAGVIRENNPELATRYEQKESTAIANNLNIEAIYPDAAAITVSTLIVSQSDAQAEADRRALLASVPRTVFELSAFAAPFAMRLGQTIAVDYPKYFSGGRSAVITRLNDMPAQNAVRLEVWR